MPELVAARLGPRSVPILASRFRHDRIEGSGNTSMATMATRSAGRYGPRMSRTAPCFVFTPQVGAGYAGFRERVRAAEETGFDGFWVVDHMWGRGVPDVPCLEGWSLVTALAEATTTLRLGVLVTCNSYRNPGMLAKAVVTADHVSGGRVELGLGAGWMEEEYAAYGFEFPGVRTRLDQLAETLEIVTRLFTQPRTTVDGRFYRFVDAPFEPKPVQRPLPITIGGAGPKVLMKLVARYAQRWNCPMPAAPRLQEHLSALRAHCRDIGRDPAEVVVSEQIAVILGKDDASLRAKRATAERMIGGFVDIESMAICGTPNAVIDRLAQKIESGVRDFAILFGDFGAPDSLELFASRVRPALKLP
jgi:F420-dependent oxidoreductase-like protein